MCGEEEGEGGGKFLSIFGTVTPPRLIGRFTWNLVCKYIIMSGKWSFTFKFILIIFLALWPKVHFSLENHQQEIALSPLPLGLLIWNLVCRYIGVVWMFMYIFKSLLAKFLPILPKIQFYTFYLITPKLIDQFQWNLFGIYIMYVYIVKYIFKFIYLLFLAVLPKNLFFNIFHDRP